MTESIFDRTHIFSSSLIERFRAGDNESALDAFDAARAKGTLDTRTISIGARQVATEGFPAEAIYMLHDLIWTDDDKPRLKMHGYNNAVPVAPPAMASDYIWALARFERSGEAYPYDKTKTAPPMTSVAFFHHYNSLSRTAEGHVSFITDGALAQFETLIRDGGADRTYDLKAVRAASAWLEKMAEKTFVRDGTECQFKEDLMFLTWPPMFHALVLDHPHASKAAKGRAFEKAVSGLHDYFDCFDGEKANPQRRRLPRLPRDIGALIYFLGDEGLVKRLKNEFATPAARVDGDPAHLKRIETRNESILDRMGEAAERWPFLFFDAPPSKPVRTLRSRTSILTVGQGENARKIEVVVKPRRPRNGPQVKPPAPGKPEA